MVIRAGDPIPVDGVVVVAGALEVAESALTGESDLIAKSQGDSVLSGSFCVTGGGLMEATRVGEQSFANQLTQHARRFRLEQTPLQRNVNRLLRILPIPFSELNSSVNWAQSYSSSPTTSCCSWLNCVHSSNWRHCRSSFTAPSW